MDTIELKKKTKKPKTGKRYLCYFAHAGRWDVLERKRGEWAWHTANYTQYYSDTGGAVTDWWDLPF